VAESIDNPGFDLAQEATEMDFSSSDGEVDAVDLEANVAVIFRNNVHGKG